MTERKQFLDYAKAICIVFVLMDHLGYGGLNYLDFVLPAFFISAGYTFRTGSAGFGAFAKKRAKRLLVPFWGAMLVYTVMEIVRSRVFGYSDASSVCILSAFKAVYGSGMVPKIGKLGEIIAAATPWQELSTPPVDIILPSNCHLWFLPAMFTACCLYYPVSKKAESAKLKPVFAAAITVILLLAAGVETLPGMSQLPYSLGRGFAGAAFMIFGYFLKQSGIFEKAKLRLQLTVTAVCAAVSVGAVLLGSGGGGMVISSYGPYPVLSVFVFFAGGCCSSVVVLMLCRFLETSKLESVKKLFFTVGSHTMETYLWHFIVINISDFIYLAITHEAIEPLNFYTSVVSPSDHLYKFCLLLITIAVLTFLSVKKEQMAASRTAKQAR